MDRSMQAGWAAALALGMLSVTAPPVAAAPRAPRDCGQLRITDSLPVPAAGQQARRRVVVNGDCRLTYESVQVTPVLAGRTYRTSSDMYDCCNILMTSLTTARTEGEPSTYDTHVNREPWDAGWTVEKVTRTGGTTETTRAEFSYRGIFDPTGRWYYNVHDTSVTVAADGTATCRQSVELRHTFIGWHWEHSCS